MNNVTKTALAFSLVFASQARAAAPDYPSLGCDSTNAIAFSAVKGALAGLGVYLAGHWLTHDFKLPSFSQHKGGLALSATAGAVVNAFWKFAYVSETQFKYAKKGLFALDNDDLLALVLNVDMETVAQSIREFLFREKLPLYVAFTHLNVVFENLDSYYDSLSAVLASSRTDLYQEASELQVLIDIYQQVIEQVFMQLRADPNFLNECNAGTLEEIQYAQMLAAQAAQSAAFAQWARPDVVVVEHTSPTLTVAN